jgi:hypothetical protein
MTGEEDFIAKTASRLNCSLNFRVRMVVAAHCV